MQKKLPLTQEELSSPVDSAKEKENGKNIPVNTILRIVRASILLGIFLILTNVLNLIIQVRLWSQLPLFELCH
jgi:hypothetical protein